MSAKTIASEGVNEHSTESADAAAFREKIRSIQFLGRGKANRAKTISSRQQRERDEARVRGEDV